VETWVGWPYYYGVENVVPSRMWGFWLLGLQVLVAGGGCLWVQNSSSDLSRPLPCQERLSCQWSRVLASFLRDRMRLGFIQNCWKHLQIGLSAVAW
jgi:hypothetical protein